MLHVNFITHSLRNRLLFIYRVNQYIRSRKIYSVGRIVCEYGIVVGFLVVFGRIFGTVSVVRVVKIADQWNELKINKTFTHNCFDSSTELVCNHRHRTHASGNMRR